MKEYYSSVADEYEAIYERDLPGLRTEREILQSALMNVVRGKRVLDVACGTGYWIEIYSVVADAVVGIDISWEMINIARLKSYRSPTQLSLQDAHSLSLQRAVFDAAVSTFWFSHIRRERVVGFLEGLHRVLSRNSTVFLADNVYVPGLGGCLLSQEGDDNTYKQRRLSDGTEHKVLKNYYSHDEIGALIRACTHGATPIDTFFGNYYWYMTYRTP